MNKETSNIFEFRDKVVETYKTFSQSFAMIKAQDIRDEVSKECNDKKRFWPDPLLQVNPFYKPGKSITELVDEHYLHPECKNIFTTEKGDPLKLYLHQEQAIDLANQKKSFVVTTGTGSGKSLCFFIPIVNAILQAKEQERKSGKQVRQRTRAIVLYPMNALANSQKEEIEKFLKNSSLGEVTVGRYTGQENTQERNQLKTNPPDILLTNYMMLELVLMRPSDKELVDNCKELNFIVLDELHTYRGRQGADVAMLMRRLRTQLAAENLICIGTSATMSSVGDRKQQSDTVAGFASKLFGEKISPAQVISESLSRVTHGAPIDLIRSKNLLEDAVKEVAHGKTDVSDFSVLAENPLAIWFELNLSVSADYLRMTPKSRPVLVKQLEKDSGCDTQTCEKAFDFLLSQFSDDSELKTEKGRNPFPLKLHQFLSGPGKVYVTLHAPGDRDITLVGQRYSSKFPGTETPLFEAHFCRECGQEHLPVWVDRSGKDIIRVNPRDIGEVSEVHEFGYICPVTSDQKYHDEDDLPTEWRDHKTQKIKPSRKKHIPEQITLNSAGQVCSNGTAYWYVPGKFKLCTNCLQTFNTSGREQNRLIGLSGEGRSSATTVITLQMLRQLHIAAEKEGAKGEKRKVLGFSDNRQDAALQAGHFNDFVHQLIIRSALLNVLKKREGDALDIAELEDGICNVFSFGMDGKNNREFLASSVRDSGNDLTRAVTAVRFLLCYRLLADLHDIRLHNNPTLEHLGLLEISYQGLKELASEGNIPFALLGSITANERYRLFKMFLDEVRKKQCIASRYLDVKEQETIKGTSYELLNDRWALRDLSGSRSFVFDTKDDKQRKILHLVRFGERSGLTRRIKELDIWSKYEKDFPELKNERTKVAFHILQGLCEALTQQGIIKSKTTSGITSYQLDQNYIRWTYTGEKPVRPNTNLFFRSLYTNLADELDQNPKILSNIEASEHTAQLTSEERKELEQRFRANQKDIQEWNIAHKGQEFKRIPILFCSPTMELGIDISALNYVYMRNVPPTPANYVQRAGRAGRSGQQAFCAVYCTAMSPHDQWFFKHPEDMVKGIVREPTIELTNESLIRCHLHSTWLSVARPNLATTVAEILDLNDVELPIKKEISVLLKAKETTDNAIEAGKKLLQPLKEVLLSESWFVENYVEEVMSKAYVEFDKSFDSWRNLYKATMHQIEISNQKAYDAGSSKLVRDIAKKRLDSAWIQREKLLQKSSSSNTEFYTYRYLASQGFLPGYNFPALPMVAWIPEGSEESPKDVTMLSRARFLGITEFGPRNLIYHKGKIFRIDRLKLNIQNTSVTAGKNLPTNTIAVCPQCGYGHLLGGDTLYNSCENCGAPLQQEDFIQGLYQVSMVETKEVERITIEDENRRSHGYEMQTIYRFAKGVNGKPIYKKLEIRKGDEVVAKLTYAPSASIQRANLGWRSRTNQKTKGFVINPLTGYWEKAGPDSIEDDGNIIDQEEQDIKGFTQTIVPFVEDKRNILLIEPQIFKDKLFTFEESMATLQSALKQAIERFYEIESSEIFVEPLPNANHRKMLLIYESGEGGAGVLRDIIENPSNLRAIAEKALHIMHYEKHGDSPWSYEGLINNKDSCIAGCYECLLTYQNQPEHNKINRKDEWTLRFLVALANGGEVVSEETQTKQQVQPPAGKTQLAAFLNFLTDNHLNLPDKLPKTFKRLNLTLDGAYSGEWTCITATPLTQDDRQALEEKGWRVIDVSDADNWNNLVEKHPEVFGTKK